MEIGIYTPYSGNPLVDELIYGLHCIDIPVSLCTPSNIDSFEYVIIFNVVWHANKDTMIYDWDILDYINQHQKIVFIDNAEYGWNTRNKDKLEKYANIYSPEAIKYRPPYQQKLRNFLNDKTYPYFIREYSKYINYCGNYFPIDYVIHPSTINILPSSPVSFEEFNMRDYDIICIWGNSHPFRNNITEELNKINCKKIISFNKINQSMYYSMLSTCKLCVSFDGCGSSSFREYEIPTHTSLFMNNLSIEQYMPFVNEESCIKYNVYNSVNQTEESPDSTDIKDKIEYYLNNIGKLYEIYVNGLIHVSKYKTPISLANYVINTINAFNWNGLKTKMKLDLK